MTYQYTLTSLRESSAKYGNCDVCHKHVSEVFIQRETREYAPDHWTHEGCHTLFGHKECLERQRKSP